jgi:ATP-dependent Clp protease ATP-binding subunit ClpC
VERRFPEGDQFVFVRSDGKAIQAEFVDPDSGEREGADAAAPVSSDKRQALPALILAARGEAAELKSLEHHFETIKAAFASDAWEEVKAGLAAKIQASDFWTRPERYEVLTRLALMDRVRAASETAESFRARLARGSAGGGTSSKELVARLALQLHLIGEGIKDVYEAAPIEAVLSVEPALEGGDRRGDPDECADGLWRCIAPGRVSATCSFRMFPRRRKSRLCCSSAASGPIGRSRTKRGCTSWKCRERRNPSTE